MHYTVIWEPTWKITHHHEPGSTWFEPIIWEHQTEQDMHELLEEGKAVGYAVTCKLHVD